MLRQVLASSVLKITGSVRAFGLRSQDRVAGYVGWLSVTVDVRCSLALLAMWARCASDAG